MDRHVWITAAFIIDKHGANALTVVDRTIAELECDRARGGSSAELELWCETARALLEILRAIPKLDEAVH